ncbi:MULTISPECIES: sensor N-terminal transmembrane domain-containing protein [unclassified Epibacterium]|uniref:sensor N-terminal transmembrane domain-containing protein n=1 Tax=unclassified Epibacterium TaxID=2639179 RepID=UPI001EF5ACE8|nr:MULTISPECIES: sensor N-terminal transmembrane domain-containing protein [unclassified Epibacterium]MCG7624133.1 sensor N-terminal transmembrane domain-containing protein [Epibacterium sp. Ofav1-8]MCG7630432.1 sensor N-terminal transmembrane domain-containing protein [Epibacterium sp. MM17-32]
MRDSSVTDNDRLSGRDRRRDGDVVLGDDWVAPEQTVGREMQARRARRGLFSLRSSPLTRKIITFNLIALIILVSGILYLNSSRQSLVYQRLGTLVSEAMLASDVLEAELPAESAVSLAAGEGIDVSGALQSLSLRGGVEVFVYDADLTLVGRQQGVMRADALNRLNENDEGRTLITDSLTAIWTALGGGNRAATPPDVIEIPEAQLADLTQRALAEGTQVSAVPDTAGGTVYAAATPILHLGNTAGVLVMTSATGEIDRLVRSERERVLQMFVVALLVSVGLSLVLASTIANPLADLAEAAELGKDRDSDKVKPGRIRIPDLSARPDEIGRLSRALRGMVKALYNRIDSNEQFAADVAHEIKNPLASLQSAVGTLRMVHREDQREKLMEVIEHDVRRLDRLVSDISNASRLDAELVKEDEEDFDLLTMLGNLNQYLGEDARGKGIDYITELPNEPILIRGLEARLAQVFVNLITNAISFCEEGDAIRVWARRRDNRVLVVVEDTGPGIPEQALSKIFKRFYSQRPDEHFGNNSGLGLAISKQIVEAHGGVIWAENIRPTEADLTSEPLGARFVVGLPV